MCKENGNIWNDETKTARWSFLQETHSDEKIVTDWAKEWNGLSFLSHKTSCSGGVAMLFAKSFTACSV